MRVLKIFTSFLVQTSSIFYEESKSEKKVGARLKFEKSPKNYIFWAFWVIFKRAQRAWKCARAKCLFKFWFSIKHRCVLHQKRIDYIKIWQLNIWLKMENFRKMMIFEIFSKIIIFGKFSKRSSKNSIPRTFQKLKGTKSWKIRQFRAFSKDYHTIINQGGSFWSPPI